MSRTLSGSTAGRVWRRARTSSTSGGRALADVGWEVDDELELVVGAIQEGPDDGRLEAEGVVAEGEAAPVSVVGGGAGELGAEAGEVALDGLEDGGGCFDGDVVAAGPQPGAEGL